MSTQNSLLSEFFFCLTHVFYHSKLAIIPQADGLAFSEKTNKIRKRKGIEQLVSKTFSQKTLFKFFFS